MEEGGLRPRKEGYLLFYRSVKFEIPTRQEMFRREGAQNSGQSLIGNTGINLEVIREG